MISRIPLMRKHIIPSVIFFFALVFLSPTTLLAEEEGIVRYGVSPVSLQDDFFDGYGEKGYLPVRLTGYTDSRRIVYFTRWMKNTDNIKWFGYFGKTGAEFDNLNSDLREKNFYLIDVSGYKTPGGIRYAGIWYENKTGVQWLSYRDYTKANMQFLHDTIGQAGWRPHRIEGYDLGGDSKYISLWYHLPNASYYWHSKLTKEQYDDHFDQYREMGYLPFHLDSHTVGGVVYFSGIWKKVSGGAWIRSNRTWNVFQRYYNNYWSTGYNIDNFYAAETPDGVRFGGIWFFDGLPVINTSLFLRMRNEVDGMPGRGGAAMMNLNTGEEVMLHADQTFATASVIKIGILYALMREVDAGNKSLNDIINAGAQYGNNQGNWLTANQNYTSLQMAQFMIRSSNNWATNRMIDYLGGIAAINLHLSEPAGLNLAVTRLRRYMLGTGAPSAYGNASANDDHEAGIQSLSTPREMMTIIRRVRDENLLTVLSKLTFFATLKMDGDNDGVNNKNYIPFVVTPAFPGLSIFNKDGSLSSVRINKSDAGLMVMPSGEVVVYAIFMDEISDDPDVPGVASNATVTAATTALQNTGLQIAFEYY
jgi:beta-lactamase class A